AVALPHAFDFPHAAEIAMIALAISPLAALIPVNLIKVGRSFSFPAGLIAMVALLSVVVVPLLVALVGRFLGWSSLVLPLRAAGVVAAIVLLPLVAGMVVRALRPVLADRIELPASLAGTVVLRLATLALLLTSLHAIWALIVNGTVIAIAVVVVVGFAAGHVLGGASSEWTDRSRPRRWLPPPCRRPCHRGGKLVGATFCRCARAVPVARRNRRPAVHDLATTQPRFAHLCRGGGHHSGCAREGSRRPPGGTRGAVLSRSLDRAEPVQQRDLAVVGQRRRC